MAWTAPDQSRSKVKAAGKILAGRESSLLFPIEEARGVAANWRSSHGYPLHVVAASVKMWARQLDDKCFIARRLKRLPSIQFKLQRFPQMQLTTMQDLGGCRVVFFSVDDVKRLLDRFRPKATRCIEVVKVYDYLEYPKEDGYRSVHVVCRYRASKANYEMYDGHLIEVQIRSRVQHIWSTAVELADVAFTQTLKLGGGTAKWRRFFQLMSEVLRYFEVSAFPLTELTRDSELNQLSEELRVVDAFTAVLQGVESHALPKGYKFIVLQIDFSNKSIESSAYRSEQRASAYYTQLEEATSQKDGIQVVLISLDKYTSMAQAYPNYAFDIEQFRMILSYLGGT